MESLLGPLLVNLYLACQNCLDRCPLEYKLLHYRWYVDDIFVLFKSFDRFNPLMPGGNKKFTYT